MDWFHPAVRDISDVYSLFHVHSRFYNVFIFSQHIAVLRKYSCLKTLMLSFRWPSPV